MAFRAWLGVLSMALVVASACGGTAVIDSDGDSSGGALPDDDGSGAGGNPTGSPTGSPTGTSTGMPFDPDGIIRVDQGVQMRIVSYPFDCSQQGASPPFDQCGWYDIEITLFVEDLIEGFVVTPESGQGTSTLSVAEPEPQCSAAGGGGGLFGTVTIVDVQQDRVIVELGPDWGAIAFDPSLSPVGQHSLARCD